MIINVKKIVILICSGVRETRYFLSKIDVKTIKHIRWGPMLFKRKISNKTP